MPAHHARLLPGDLLGISLPPRGPAGHGPDDVQSLLSDLGRCRAAWELLGPHLTFAPEGYLRKRLYRDAEWEMLLLCWLPGQRTVVHDHGGSWGAMLMLSGQLDECQYSVNGEDRPLAVSQMKRYGEGEVAIELLETIHKNENRTSAPAISIHFYSLPLRILNSYDPETGKKHAVKLEEGPSMAVGGRPVRR